MEYKEMNVYQKLAVARQKFLTANVKKSGKNMSLEFTYFELADIVPTATQIFAEVGLVMIPSFTEVASARVYNTDKDEAPIVFTAPFDKIEPIVSNSGKKVTNEMQALGSSITYMRRYLWQLVLDIIEADVIDAIATEDEDEKETKPKKTAKKPKTPSERNEIKEEITSIDSPADELQISALKNALKTLLETDPTQEEFVQQIALKTNGFTDISKEQCEALINGITDILKEYEVKA